MNEPLPVRIPWEYQGARPAGDLTQHTWTWRDSYLVELRDSLQNVQRRWIGQLAPFYLPTDDPVDMIRKDPQWTSATTALAATTAASAAATTAATSAHAGAPTTATASATSTTGA